MALLALGQLVFGETDSVPTLKCEHRGYLCLLSLLTQNCTLLSRRSVVYRWYRLVLHPLSPDVPLVVMYTSRVSSGAV